MVNVYFIFAIQTKGNLTVKVLKYQLIRSIWPDNICVEASLKNDFLPKLQQELHDRFGIEHSTIQIERKDDDLCMLNKNGCIKRANE